MDAQLLGTATAFGLAGAAGLNTTLPLLLVGILTRWGLLHLSHPYDAVASNEALVGLFLLAILEFVADKVPTLDSVMHAIQLPLAATAGAILFASQNSVISWVSPGLAVVVGLLTAGTVHAMRAATRPGVTAITAGKGNSALSLLEDGYSLALTGLAILSPVTALLMLLILVTVLGILAVWVMPRAIRASRWVTGRLRGTRVA